LKQDERGIDLMCQIANDIYEEGREQGIEQGIEQGELLKAKDMAYNLARMGVSLDKIAEAAKVSIQIIRQWLDSSGMSIA
jgi:predicted transposase/invertase (TIGR01784 family)